MNLFNYPNNLQKWLIEQEEKKTEAFEQIQLCEFLNSKGIRFTAIPNSTYTLSWMQKAKNTALGLRKGIPDLLCIVPCWDGKKRIVFVEMKRQKGSTVSEEQKEWVRVLEECEEVSAQVCRGADEAIEFIEKLL